MSRHNRVPQALRGPCRELSLDITGAISVDRGMKEAVQTVTEPDSQESGLRRPLSGVVAKPLIILVLLASTIFYLTKLKSDLVRSDISSPVVLEWIHGTSDRTLQQAIERDDQAAVAALIPLTPRDRIRDSIIERLAFDDTVKSLAVFLDQGWSVDGPNHDEAPLFNALHLGQKRAVAVLLGKGANPSARDPWGHTAMIAAVGALHASPEMIELLARHGAKFDSLNFFRNRNIKAGPLGERHERPLTLAARKGDFAAIQSLLKLGASPNALPTEASSPLFVAALSPDPLRVTEILLKAGAKVDEPAELHIRMPDENRPPNGTVLYFNYRWRKIAGTPLYLNARQGNVGTVRLLLEHGADANLKNQQGESALDVAIGECASFLRDAQHRIEKVGR
jgi:hypothetical protein